MASHPNTPTTAAQLLINARGACAMLCLGRRRVWELSISGALPSLKVGRSRRYCPEELRAWVRAGCPTESGAGDLVRKAMRQ